MARGKKGKLPQVENQQEATGSPTPVSDSVVDSQVAEAVAEAAVEAVPVVETPGAWTLEQAAHALIHDFREGWLSGIRVRAHLMGKNVHKFHSLDEWREVFVAWGGQGILK